jgi:hypothetical protein
MQLDGGLPQLAGLFLDEQLHATAAPRFRALHRQAFDFPIRLS